MHFELDRVQLLPKDEAMTTPNSVRHFKWQLNYEQHNVYNRFRQYMLYCCIVKIRSFKRWKDFVDFAALYSMI